jgi:Ni,Fe-hydrogenase III small subunit
MVLVGSIRHADVLLLSGMFNRKSCERLKRVYHDAPKPIVVVAVGNCACTGNIFRPSYNFVEPVCNYIPVDAFLPGCPPKPEAMLSAVVKLVGKLRGGA